MKVGHQDIPQNIQSFAIVCDLLTFTHHKHVLFGCAIRDQLRNVTVASEIEGDLR